MLSSEYVSGVVFWDDKLLFDSFDFAADDTASSDWYVVFIAAVVLQIHRVGAKGQNTVKYQ